MNKQHLPYNILLVITVVSVSLMAISSLSLRQSSFGVTVLYRIPQPTAAELPPPPEPPRLTEPQDEYVAHYLYEEGEEEGDYSDEEEPGNDYLEYDEVYYYYFDYTE